MSDIYNPGWHYAIPRNDDPAVWDGRARACYRKRFQCDPPGAYVTIDVPPMHVLVRVLVYPLPVTVPQQAALEGVL